MSLIPPTVPFEFLPPVSAPTRRRLGQAALEANERYLVEVVEGYGFCPYSKAGRRRDASRRYVLYADDEDGLFETVAQFFEERASDRSEAVLQLIFPALEVEARDWRTFAMKLTDYAHAKMGGHKVFACAPLHAELSYNDGNPNALIPLFRRSPDPTIQWVRLDALEKIYHGRKRTDIFVPSDKIAEFLSTLVVTESLYDRIARTNQEMAHHIRIPVLDKMLAEISTSAARRYAALLIEDDEPPDEAGRGRIIQGDSVTAYLKTKESDGCPFQASIANVDRDQIGIGRWSELQDGSPVRVQVDGVELVLFRHEGQPRVFYGRCAHRHALLSEGRLTEGKLVCGAHGWEYDVDTGDCANPCGSSTQGASLKRFKTWVSDDDGQVYIRVSELEEWRQKNASPFFLNEDLGA